MTQGWGVGPAHAHPGQAAALATAVEGAMQVQGTAVAATRPRPPPLASPPPSGVGSAGPPPLASPPPPGVGSAGPSRGFRNRRGGGLAPQGPLALGLCTRLHPGRRAVASGWTGFHGGPAFVLWPTFSLDWDERAAVFIPSASSLERNIAVKGIPSSMSTPGLGPGSLGAWQEGLQGPAPTTPKTPSPPAPSPVASGIHTQACARHPGAAYRASVFTSMNSRAIIIMEFTAAFTYSHLLRIRHLL